MPRARHYTPELRRFLVTVLYHEAKEQGVPMTVLANDLLTRSLQGGQGWKKAEEQWRLPEQPVPYRTS